METKRNLSDTAVDVSTESIKFNDQLDNSSSELDHSTQLNVEESCDTKIDATQGDAVQVADASTSVDIDSLISKIGESKEEEITTENVTAPVKPVVANNSSNTKWWIISIVVILLSAIAGCGIGYYYLSTLEDKAEEQTEGSAAVETRHEVVDVESPVEDDAVQPIDGDATVAHRTFDYGSWSDLNRFFNADAVSMLDLGRYMVNTSELCYSEHRWSKPSLDRSATEAYVYAHPSLRIRTAPSTSATSTIINGLLYGSKVRIIERVNNEWVEVEVISGDFEHPDAQSAYIGLRGYVNTQFLTTEKMFNIMDRHVTPSVERRNIFNETKWRRAMTDILYALGVTPASPVVDIDVVAKFERREIPESLLVLHVNSSEDNVELLAFVEFYDADEEYRILGVVPGTGIAMDGGQPCIEFNGVGDYDIIYLNE